MCVKSILGVKMFRCFPQVYTTRIVYYCCLEVFFCFFFLLSVDVLCCFLLVCLHSLISLKKLEKINQSTRGFLCCRFTLVTFDKWQQTGGRFKAQSKRKHPLLTSSLARLKRWHPIGQSFHGT